MVNHPPPKKKKSSQTRKGPPPLAWRPFHVTREGEVLAPWQRCGTGYFSLSAPSHYRATLYNSWTKRTAAVEADRLWLYRRTVSCVWWEWRWWLFPRVRGFWNMFDNLFPAYAFFFFLGEFSLHTLFRPISGQSGSASWDDCDRVFPDELRVRSFPDRFPRHTWTAAQSARSDFVGSLYMHV